MRLYIYIIALLTIFTPLSICGQEFPERRLVRRGNEDFEKKEYTKAIETYSEALKSAPDNFEARYNLGTALFKGGESEQSKKILEPMSQDSTLTCEQRAELLYNLGNISFEAQKLEEALELYKSSLRLNPADTNTKYNYAYTKRLLEKQNQEQQNQDEQQGEDEQQQNQDEQNQDEQQGEDEQNQDEQQGEDEQQQNQDEQQGEDEQQQNQDEQQQGGMSEQQQEQILDAIQALEDKTQEKIDGEEAKGVIIRGAKSW